MRVSKRLWSSLWLSQSCISLERNGIYHNPNTILRIMPEYNLLLLGRRNNKDNNSNMNEKVYEYLGKIMESRMNKNFRRLYKSQNQTSTKEEVNKLLETEK